MKKFLARFFITGLLSLIIFPANLSAASLRDSVCIVRGNLSSESVSFLEKYRDKIKSKGYSSYASQIDDYLKGTFGSGFVYYASNGKAYIITNRHVVNNASSVNIQFENDDGSYTEYKELKILAIGENLDAAIIELPSGFNKPGLAFSTAALSDGYDVWSAGFPGLGDEPMWQLGKGSVTNSRARIKELLDPEVSTLIQHSANVDFGNSGGPLLIKDGSRYFVVGINTWKAMYRQSTNFAIPSAVIKKFLDESVSRSNSSMKIESRLEEFKKVLGDKEKNYISLSRFISNEMLSAKAGDIFISALQKAPSEIRSQIVYTFASDPLEGLKYALCYDIWNRFHDGENLIEYTFEVTSASDEENKVVFKINEENYTTYWTLYQSRWCIKEVDEKSVAQVQKKDSSANKDNPEKSDKGNSDIPEGSKMDVKNPYLFELSGGVSLDTKQFRPGFDINAGIILGDYFVMGFNAHSTKLVITKDIWNSPISPVEKNVNMYGLNLSVRVPVKVERVIIEPKAHIRFSFAAIPETKTSTYGSDFSGVTFAFTVGGGLNLSFMCTKSTAILIGAEYNHIFCKGSSSGDISITAGIKCFRKG
ncbi:serine protease [Treponema sp.]|uniref:serine protease n=1 Tax=Treponema sp. TaxID=166 RepID=UPI00298DF714|nr:serine protease [Treponema sp.]MCR5612864.1 serine protease [Treponema sp.]